MKTIVHISTVSIISFFLLSSCVKVTVAPESPLAGSWVLTSASEGDSYGWSPLYTGLENGVFYLSNNGSAEYSDANVSMQGNWYISTVSGGYFDEYGGYYNGPHQALQLHLADAYTHSSIDLNFDNVTIYNGRFVATYFNGNLIERYDFGRYQ